MKGIVISLSNKTALIGHSKINVGETKTRQFYGQLIKIK